MKVVNMSDSQIDKSSDMPVLFVGHGNPMNAIQDNEFTLGWNQIGETIPHPKAILCISAHWETLGTKVTALQNPPTIHDFGGFPKELYDVQYPAPGSPELAQQVINNNQNTLIEPDESWGLDHGTWSVLKHIYPKADIPVVQLSLNYRKSPREHYEFAKELTTFRNKGVLIIGSGNIVHNLRQVAWDKPADIEYGFEWALEANETIKQLILNNEYDRLINYKALSKAVQLAVPTPDHYIPLLYALALKSEHDTVSFFNDKTVMGSLSMTSVQIG